MASKKSDPQAPLVSIICRTMGRPELEEALASAAGQTHSRLEIILVDASSRGEAAYRDVCVDERVVFVSVGKPLSRPRAANAGLERARGDYLLLLDEDDWLAPEHVERLLDYLASQRQVRATYSSTQKTDESGKNVLETFRQPFDRFLLMRDNYIPIHSMLFAREPVDKGCRFDERFDIFEDWDFWLQLSEHTDFHHIDRVTAFYRSGGASQTALDDHLQRFDPEHRLGKARAAIYDKWLRRWDGDRLNRLLGAGQRELGLELDKMAESKQVAERKAIELNRELDKLAESKQVAERKAAELNRELDKMSESKQVAERKAAELNRELDKLAESKRVAERKAAELNRELDKLAESKRVAERKAAELAESKRKAEQKAAELNQELAHQLSEARKAQARLNQMIDGLQTTNVGLHDTIQALRGNLEEVFNSNSWKLTRPYRALGELLKPRSAQVPAEQSAAAGAVEPTKQQAPASLTAKQDLPRVVDRVSTSRKPPVASQSAKQIEPHDFKAEFDQQAFSAMNDFLAGDEKLLFPAAEHPVLSVLLVFYNQAHLSLLCLRTLLENADTPFELIIVDNASTDRTGDLLERVENAKLIRNRENLGFVKAVNQAAELAAGDHLLLLNNDAFIESGALSSAVEVLRRDAGAGAVGGRIELLDGKLQEAGNIIWQDGSCAGYGRGGNPDDAAFRFRREVDYCSGAFLMFRTAQFRELGGFDEAFAPAYYEESDFCLRLRQQGLRTIYEPRIKLRHYEFASTGGMDAAAALQEKHRALFRGKHADFLQHQPEANPARTLHARSSNRHPNLLLIDDAVPHTSLGGGYPRCRHIVGLLAHMPLNVGFFPLHFPYDSWDEVYRTLPEKVEVLLNRGRSGLSQLLAERAGFYQYVMVSRPTNMAFFNKVLQSLPREAKQFEIIYDAEAVFAGRELLWRELQGESIAEEEKNRVISEELELAADAAAVLTVSEAEAELFRERGHERVMVLGHGMELASNPAPFDTRRGLLFVGALRDEHSPNVDSLLWFVSSVLPLIERELPGLDLAVAGHTAAPSLVSIERPNVHMKGRVESLDGLYRDCRVFIAPTRFAAGIPHKVHEAAAHGIPAVVTPLLARQLGWRHEREVLVGDGPESFAEQCLRLHRDAELWERISAGAREAVARDCSAERFRETLEEAFNQDGGD